MQMVGIWSSGIWPLRKPSRGSGTSESKRACERASRMFALLSVGVVLDLLSIYKVVVLNVAFKIARFYSCFDSRYL